MTAGRRGRSWAAAAAGVIGLCAAAVALQWAGRGSLAPPPLTDPGQWGAWLDAHGPVPAAFSLVRLAAVAALWYLAVTTSIGLVVRAAGAASLVRLTDRVTIAPVRRLLAGSVGLGLAASGVAAAAPGLRVPVAVAAAAQLAAPPSVDTPPATVTMHRLGPAEGPVAPALVPVPEVAATATGPAPDRWTVKPGECFWSIADSVLTAHWGRPPTDAEIVPYWRRLIDANRHELAHRDDPDLVFPGQIFAVPAP